MDLEKEYLRKLKRGRQFSVTGPCQCGSKALFPFYDKFYCSKCWITIKPWRYKNGLLIEQ